MLDPQSCATIMVVDDTPANLKLLQEMLLEKGYRVQTFTRAAMALRAAARTPPDLILLDITMPEMGGFEACARIKADPVLKDIAVIFISALTDTTDKVKAFAVGGVDYVTKPFQVEEVHARVATHLRLRNLQAELAQHNCDLQNQVAQKIRELSDAQRATILVLTKLAESRDHDTGGHIERTQFICKLLAERLRDDVHYAEQVDDNFVENIYQASPLHDIGKISIPDSILLKPGKLMPEEFEIMKSHTIHGSEPLQAAFATYPPNSFLTMCIAIARSHHEKWDGSGYPDHLVGEQIPLAARIMAIADVYDALRSKRPYKPSFSHEQSINIMLEYSDRHFDSGVLKAFLDVDAVF